jgi:hypothetical protein
MDRNLWRDYYNLLPSFRCPRCRTGALKLQNDTRHKLEPSYSRNRHGDEDWTPMDDVERFVCLIVCQNIGCGEVVTVAGEIDQDVYVYEDEDGPRTGFQPLMRPMSIRPSPHIIPVSPKLKKECAVHLRKAFELFWVDSASCANRIRIFVECLLDQLHVERLPPSGKGREFTLARRIELLAAKGIGHADTIDSLRNAGNFASHSGNAKRETVLDCFELLEEVLTDLVDGKKARLDGLRLKLSTRNGDF